MKRASRERRWLLVFTHPTLHAQVISRLQPSMLRVQEAADAQLVFEQIWHTTPDLLLIESGGQHTEAVTFCERVRTFFQLPILVVVQGSNELERIALLESGADDVVVLEHGLGDLVARCHALCRRVERQVRHDAGAHYLRIRNVELDIAGRRLLLPNAQINLTLPLTKLLALLFSYHGAYVPRQTLIKHVFGDITPYTEIRLSTLIKTLRRRVEHELGYPPLVVNMKGHGYRIALSFLGDSEGVDDGR